jgi:hypothetical protein
MAFAEFLEALSHPIADPTPYFILLLAGWSLSLLVHSLLLVAELFLDIAKAKAKGVLKTLPPPYNLTDALGDIQPSAFFLLAFTILVFLTQGPARTAACLQALRAESGSSGEAETSTSWWWSSSSSACDSYEEPEDHSAFCASHTTHPWLPILAGVIFLVLICLPDIEADLHKAKQKEVKMSSYEGLRF